MKKKITAAFVAEAPKPPAEMTDDELVAAIQANLDEGRALRARRTPLFRELACRRGLKVRS